MLLRQHRLHERPGTSSVSESRAGGSVQASENGQDRTPAAER